MAEQKMKIFYWWQFLPVIGMIMSIILNYRRIMTRRAELKFNYIMFCIGLIISCVASGFAFVYLLGLDFVLENWLILAGYLYFLSWSVAISMTAFGNTDRKRVNSDLK